MHLSVTGIVQLVYRTQAYASYYKDVVPQNLGVLELLTLTFGSLGILGYTFSNLNSTALLFRKSKMAESVGRTWVIFYDSLFIIALLGWVGGCFVSSHVPACSFQQAC